MTHYPWHHRLDTQLSAAFEQGRGHHALLFKTELGLDTTRFLLDFAAKILCRHGTACAECKSCLLWQSGNHPDFHLIEPIENRDIGVDQIRELTAKLQQFAQQGGNIVVLVKGVERLTESAANALLKTLEEPHDNVYFLLEAPLQAPIPATIQSRCQTWLINAPSQVEALAWLAQECPTFSSEELAIALRLNHRRPLFCKVFLENNRLPQRKTFLQTFWKFFKSRDVWLLLSAFETEKEGVLQQLEWIESFFADSLKAKLEIAENWINPDLYNGILLFSQALSSFHLLKGQQIIQQIRCDLQTVNAVNQELMLANGLSRLVLEVFE